MRLVSCRLKPKTVSHIEHNSSLPPHVSVTGIVSVAVGYPLCAKGVISSNPTLRKNHDPNSGLEGLRGEEETCLSCCRTGISGLSWGRKINSMARRYATKRSSPYL